MYKLLPTLALALAVAACTPAPVAAPPAPAAGAAAPTTVAGTVPAAGTTTPGTAPIVTPPIAAQSLRIAGDFPAIGASALKSGYFVLATANVTIDDLNKLTVKVDGKEVPTGTFRFSNVVVKDGKLKFKLEIDVAPKEGQNVDIGNKTKSFSMSLRNDKDATRNDENELEMTPRSTAIALLRMEQAKRGVPTDGPLPKKLIDAMEKEVEKLLGDDDDDSIGAKLVEIAEAAANNADKDDDGQFVDDLTEEIIPGGSGGGGSSGSSDEEEEAVLSASAFKFGALGKTGNLSALEGNITTVTSNDPGVATVAESAPGSGVWVVTAVAIGITTLTVETEDDVTHTVSVSVTTTAVTVN